MANESFEQGPIAELAAPGRDEGWLTLTEARALVPGRPNVSTLFRWCRDGVSIGGQRVRLEFVRAGRRFFITREAIGRFLEAQSAADLAAHDAQAVVGGMELLPKGRTEKRRGREIAAARARLEKAGI